MPDPLTLSVMSQIVKKTGGKEASPENTASCSQQNEPHLTGNQAVLLSDLINKKKTVGAVNQTQTTPITESRVSLAELVKSSKTR